EVRRLPSHILAAFAKRRSERANMMKSPSNALARNRPKHLTLMHALTNGAPRFARDGRQYALIEDLFSERMLTHPPHQARRAPPDAPDQGPHKREREYGTNNCHHRADQKHGHHANSGEPEYPAHGWENHGGLVRVGKEMGLLWYSPA